MTCCAPRLRLIEPPATLPVTLDEARAWCRVDSTDEDAVLAAAIDAAVGALDGRSGFLGRCLEAQTWEAVSDCFPSGGLYLPLGPVASVTSVEYDDAGGIAQTVDPASYVLDAVSLFYAWVWPVSGFSWPATGRAPSSVRVRFVAGTGTPEVVRNCILEMVATRFDSRGLGGKLLTPGVVSDLAPHRRPVVATW